MVIQLESTVRPLVQFALCRDAAQYPLWDSKLDYGRNSLPDRILAYGVAISEEGSYVCSELGPFESHPLLRQFLTSWELYQSHRRRRRVMQWWPQRDEANRIEKSIRLLQRRMSHSRLRKRLARIWSVSLPAIIMYSIDGERNWKTVEPTEEKWINRLLQRWSREKTIDTETRCLMLNDRKRILKETDTKQWLKQRLTDRDNGCSIYTPGRQAYSLN